MEPSKCSKTKGAYISVINALNFAELVHLFNLSYEPSTFYINFSMLGKKIVLTLELLSTFFLFQMKEKNAFYPPIYALIV